MDLSDKKVADLKNYSPIQDVDNSTKESAGDCDRPKYLTTEEIIEMDRNHSKNLIYRIKYDVYKERKLKIKSQIDAALLQVRLYEKELKLLEFELADFKRSDALRAEKQKSFVQTIRNRLNIINEKWGYDPYSGEIKEE